MPESEIDLSTAMSMALPEAGLADDSPGKPQDRLLTTGSCDAAKVVHCSLASAVRRELPDSAIFESFCVILCVINDLYAAG